MSNETDIIHSIAQNPWTVIITLIAVVIVALIASGEAIITQINKPKLSYRVRPDVQLIKYQGQFDYYQIKFMVDIKNKGKRIAEHCLARMRITDPSGKINIVDSPIKLNDDFQTFLLDEEQIGHPSYDFSRSDRYEASINIPINIQLAKNQDDVLGEKHLPLSVISFDPPVEKWKVNETHGNAKYLFEVRVEIRVTSTTIVSKKNVIIKIPQPQKSIVDPNTIEFKLKRWNF